jgi:hypothetical protein
MVPILFPWGKISRSADHLPAATAEVKNEWSYTSETLPLIFCLNMEFIIILLLLLLLLFTAIGFSPGGSSPYTSTLFNRKKYGNNTENISQAAS